MREGKRFGRWSRDEVGIAGRVSLFLLLQVSMETGNRSISQREKRGEEKRESRKMGKILE